MSISPSVILSRYTKTSPANGVDDSVSLSDEESGFCSEENIQECAAYLNQVWNFINYSADANHEQWYSYLNYDTGNRRPRSEFYR